MLHGYFHGIPIHQCFECATKLSHDAPHWTEQIQFLGVGFGGFFAGLGGLKIGLDWLEQKQLKRKSDRLIQRYPIDKLNTDYQLVDTKDVPGKWWLLDLRENTRHWIKNLETVRDIGWTYDMVHHNFSDKKLEQYQLGQSINTRDL